MQLFSSFLSGWTSAMGPTDVKVIGSTIRGMTCFSFFFFLKDTATTEIYTLSLHDALPIYLLTRQLTATLIGARLQDTQTGLRAIDRKSTRLNSSHLVISYAVFCLKKK